MGQEQGLHPFRIRCEHTDTPACHRKSFRSPLEQNRAVAQQGCDRRMLFPVSDLAVDFIAQHKDVVLLDRIGQSDQFIFCIGGACRIARVVQKERFDIFVFGHRFVQQLRCHQKAGVGSIDEDAFASVQFHRIAV